MYDFAFRHVVVVVVVVVDSNLFITYKGLKKDFIGVAKKVANFLGKTEISDEQFEELRSHCSFDSMKKNDMVRK